MFWNADFSVQIFSQEHFMKIVVELPVFFRWWVGFSRALNSRNL